MCTLTEQFTYKYVTISIVVHISRCNGRKVSSMTCLLWPKHYIGDVVHVRSTIVNVHVAISNLTYDPPCTDYHIVIAIMIDVPKTTRLIGKPIANIVTSEDYVGHRIHFSATIVQVCTPPVILPA
ncbi:MAG: hypothetical protein P8Z79_19325, partial [Sedimentisphaerales bacterium]